MRLASSNVVPSARLRSVVSGAGSGRCRRSTRVASRVVRGSTGSALRAVSIMAVHWSTSPFSSATMRQRAGPECRPSARRRGARATRPRGCGRARCGGSRLRGTRRDRTRCRCGPGRRGTRGGGLDPASGLEIEELGPAPRGDRRRGQERNGPGRIQRDGRRRIRSPRSRQNGGHVADRWGTLLLWFGSHVRRDDFFLEGDRPEQGLASPCRDVHPARCRAQNGLRRRPDGSPREVRHDDTPLDGDGH